MDILRFHLRDRKLSKILLPLIRILKKSEFRKTKDNSYEDEDEDREDELLNQIVEIVDDCIDLVQEIEDEEDEQLFDNTIKTLQSIDKENNTDLTWTYLVNWGFH